MVGLNAGNGAKRLALPVHSLFSDSFPATANSSVVSFLVQFLFLQCGHLSSGNRSENFRV